MGLLYEADQRDESIADVLAGLPVPPDPYAITLLEGVTAHLAEIDEIVGRYARNWSLDRMPQLDRAVLRLATYELLRTDVPTAVILVLFWHHCATFLDLGGQTGRRLAAFRVLGVVAGLSLTVYALTLGFEGDVYRQLRRAGIIGFAVSTFSAEVMFVMAYRPMRITETEKLWRWLLLLCLALPMLEIFSEFLKWAGTPRRATNNIVAWNAFVAASLYYAVVARIWWHHGFGGQFRISSSVEPKNTSAGRPASPME